MNDTLIHEIVLRFRGGASMRQIARSLHVSRRTVRRVLDQVDRARIAGPTPEELPPRPRRGSQLNAYEATIVDLLARYPDITVQRISRGIAPARVPGELHALEPAGANPAPAAGGPPRAEVRDGPRTSSTNGLLDL